MPDLTPIVDAIAEHLRATLFRYTQVLPSSLITIGKVALSAPGKSLFVPDHQDGEGPGPRQIPRWPVNVVLSYQAASEPDNRRNWREAAVISSA